MKVSIHQINTVTGDIIGNTEKIKKCIASDDTQSDIDLSVFPETSITGYMCGSLWDRVDFLKAQRSALEDIVNFTEEINYKGTVVLGYVDFIKTKKNGFPELKNSAVIIQNGLIRHYDKQLLASADHHEDKKYFEPGKTSSVFDIKLLDGTHICVGVPICEDIWTNDHKRNVPAEMVKKGAELLININQSYFYYGKQEKRIAQFSKVADECKVPLISVNSVGVGDIVKNIMIFDGGSVAFNMLGQLIYEAPQFKEHHSVIDLNMGMSTIHRVKSKYEEIVNALIFEQKEFFNLSGIKNAQVHISGGIDSAIVAAIVTKAMGKEHMVFITNPSSLNTKSMKYVKHIEEKLGIKIWVNPIQSIYEEFIKVHENSFNNSLTDTGKASVQAVLRTVQGLAACHQFKSGIVATGNHTEIVLGWASFHDIGSIGVHSLIGDLTKMELFALAKYINENVYNDEVIPEDLYNGNFKPAAELPDANEDPIDYYVQSGICAMLIRERKSPEEILEEMLKPIPNLDYFPNTLKVKNYSKEGLSKEIDFAISKMRISVYKASQAAPIVLISPRSRGFSNRETLINKFIM
jgi:NAD+ synthetase